MRLKQRLGRPRRQRRALNSDQDGHQLVIRGQIVQLFAVGPPAWRDSAARGYLPLPARPRKGADINLIAAGFVGLVGHPLAIRRKGSLLLVERRAEKGKGFRSSVNGNTIRSPLFSELWYRMKRPSGDQELGRLLSADCSRISSPPEPLAGFW